MDEYTANHLSISMLDISSLSDYTYFPWTVPQALAPQHTISASTIARPTFDITFLALPCNIKKSSVPLQLFRTGILINLSVAIGLA
jgi:hypothetical protein